MSLKAHIGKRIAIHRQSAGMTRSQLAMAVRIPTATIADYELGITLAAAPHLLEIAAVLKKKVSDFIPTEEDAERWGSTTRSEDRNGSS